MPEADEEEPGSEAAEEDEVESSGREGGGAKKAVDGGPRRGVEAVEVGADEPRADGGAR